MTTYTPTLRRAYEAISDAGIAVASGNPSLLVHKHIDAAKEAIKQVAEEKRGLLEALKELTRPVREYATENGFCPACGEHSHEKTCPLLRAEKAIAQAQEGKP